MINEVWMFALPGIFTGGTKAGLDGLKKMKVTDAVLAIHNQFTPVTTMNTAAVKSVTASLLGMDIAVHWMIQPEPTATHIKDAASTLLPLCKDIHIKSLMFDVEESWSNSKLKLGKADYAKVISDVFEPAFSSWPCPLGVTGIPYHYESQWMLMSSKLFSYVVPQGYAVYTKQAKGPYWPGPTERFAHEQYKKLGLPIVMGLSAYCVNFPGMSVTKSMETSFGVTQDTLSSPTVTKVAYWELFCSLKGAKKGTCIAEPSPAELTEVQSFVTAVSTAARSKKPYVYSEVTPADLTPAKTKAHK
jgi:hypothetical protein